MARAGISFVRQSAHTTVLPGVHRCTRDERDAHVGRITTHQIRQYARSDRKIVMVTCYDATFARLVEAADVDAVLIGDSLGMVIQGHEHTVPVTLDDIIYHARAVARGCSKPHLIGDLPFGSYQVSADDALASAARLIKEGGVQAVKLEGGEEYAETIQRMTRAGIPVMGHLGLTPQSIHQFGGYRIQGRSVDSADKLLADARALQDAGCYALVLEGIPSTLAQQVTEALYIPTIGIGAGPECRGQVLVIYDLLGLDGRFNPKFLKKYANLNESVVGAIQAFSEEVRAGQFPAEVHCYAAQ